MTFPSKKSKKAEPIIEDTGIAVALPDRIEAIDAAVFPSSVAELKIILDDVGRF